MNTEFPSRIPTVRRTANTSTNNSTYTSTTKDADDSSFQKEVSRVLKEGLKFLKSVTENVSNLLDSSEGTKKTNKFAKQEKTESEGFIEKSFNVLKETMNTLKSLTTLVSDFFNGKSNAYTPSSSDSSTNNSKNVEDPISKMDELFKLFVTVTEKFTWWSSLSFVEKFKTIASGAIKVIKAGFEKLSTQWSKGISKLQYVAENTAESIGDGIGSIFGTGLFGRMISNIITKALTFAVSKVLIGFALSNLPMTLLAGSILTAVGLVVYYSREIWDGIKWLAWSIDQGIDAILSLFTESKYKNAREQLARASGLTDEDILNYYGDTVKGRNQALEDYKRSKTDEEFKKNLISQIKEANKEALDKLPKYSSLQLDNKGSTISEFYNNTTINNNGITDTLSPYAGTLALADVPNFDAMGGMTNVNNISNTYNNTAVNAIGNNTYGNKGTLSLGGGYSNNSGGFTLGF